MSKRRIIYEVHVRRENGDVDILYLCRACIPSTSDFLVILSKKRVQSATCDRCG